MRSWPHDRAFAAGVMRRIDAARAAVRVHQATATPAHPASTSATAQAGAHSGAQSAAVDAAITSLVVSSKAQPHRR